MNPTLRSRASRKHRWRIRAGLILAGALAGCWVPREQTPPPRPGGADPLVDPSAERLHDLEGQLLLYYATNRRLPDRLEELKPYAPDGRSVEAVCPVSGKRYVYVPRGIRVPDLPGTVILYAPEPTRDDLRPVLLLMPSRPGQPLVLHVESLPGDRFDPAPEPAAG